MYFLGVDGGGTKTKYLLINQELRVICDVESGTTHIHQIGKEKLIEVLNENLELICEKGCINKNEIEYAFLGIPGYGESKSDIEDIEYSVKKVFDGINYVIGNDSVVGWAAGTGCKEGINIVAGTGSIAYGRNKKGNEARCGGWGPGIGDDASAYWIGLKILNEYTKQKDGRNEKTVLVDTLEKEYNIKDYYIERESTNCGNNVTYALRLLNEKNIEAKNIIIIQDTTMQHRMEAGFRKYDSNINIINYASYKTKVIVKEDKLTFEKNNILGMWDIERYISLLMGEIPRLNDNESGYGPKWKRLYCTC